MKLFPKVLLGVVALCFAAGASAQLTGTLKKIKDSNTITIGHRDSSIPFSYYDDKQQVIGYAMDICMKAVDAVKAELKATAPSTSSAARRRTTSNARSRSHSPTPIS